MKYIFSTTLNAVLCDADDLLTLWGLARLFQSAADNHSSSLGVGFEQLQKENRAWIITSVYYSMLRRPAVGEELTVETWAKTHNGLVAPRDYMLLDSKGNVCASGLSNWVIFNTEKRTVCRLGNFIDAYETDLDCAADEDISKKIILPESMKLLKEIEIPYSSIDHTRHVNNSEYIKWICDSSPIVCCDNKISTNNCEMDIKVNYIRETPYSEGKVNLFTSIPTNGKGEIQSNDTTFYSVTHNHGVAVNAVLRFKNI